jgi:hypothetical protein
MHSPPPCVQGGGRSATTQLTPSGIAVLLSSLQWPHWQNHRECRSGHCLWAAIRRRQPRSSLVSGGDHRYPQNPLDSRPADRIQSGLNRGKQYNRSEGPVAPSAGIGIRRRSVKRVADPGSSRAALLTGLWHNSASQPKSSTVQDCTEPCFCT